MAWWTIIKEEYFNRTTAEGILRNIKLLNSHPDFAGRVNYFREDIRHTTQKVYESVKDPEDVEFLLENFTPNELREAYIGLDYFQSRLAENRSMGFLEGMAESLGIDIEIDYGRGVFASPAVSFEFDGLNCNMTDEGLFIRLGGSKDIFVCVVDKQNLPLGDYYASLMGLMANDPDRIPALGFSIRLARILKSKGVLIDLQIFTPFGAEERDIESFVYLLDGLRENMEEKILQEIEQALVEAFGDTRGFFE